MNLLNLTPHAIHLNNGKIYEPSGIVARVSAKFTNFDENNICEQVFGNIIDLPEPVENTLYIVSALVLAAGKQAGRNDLIAPATGHPEVKRNEAGQIISVPGFVK